MNRMIQLPVGFPKEVRKWIKEQARKKFIPEAAFIRQLVVEAMLNEQKEAGKSPTLP